MKPCSVLLDYVMSHRPAFTLIGVRHRKRGKIVAEAAREIFASEENMEPAVWWRAWQEGRLPDNGKNNFLQLVAWLLQAYFPAVS